MGMSLKGIDNIYIINMKKDTERLSQIQNEIQKHNLPKPNIIEGVNVSENIPENLQKYTCPLPWCRRAGRR